MEEDQFNDFEQSKQVVVPQPQQIKTEQLSFSDPMPVAQQITFPSFEQMSINTSSALGTQSPTSQVTDPEEKGWDVSVEPNLTKFVSDHEGASGSMLTEFVKTSSQGEIKNYFPVKMDDFLFSKEGNQVEKPTLQFFDGGLNLQDLTKTNQAGPPLDFNSLTFAETSNEIKKQENLGFDYGLSFGVQKNTDLKQQLEFQHIEEEVKPIVVQSKNEVLNVVAEGEPQQPRKQSDQFVFGQQAQIKEQLTTYKEYEISATYASFQKNEQPFVFQASPIFPEPKQTIPVQTNEAELEIPKEKQIQHELQVKEVSPPQANQQIQEDDQFGQFEETVPVSMPVAVQQPNGVSEANKVSIQQQKVPYGVDANIRKQELQQLVNSLPDYSFLLVEAFNSL